MKRSALTLAALMLLTACDDDGSVTQTGCTTSDDCPGTQVCVESQCQAAPVGDTGEPDDTAEPSDTGDMTDLGGTDGTPDTGPDIPPTPDTGPDIPEVTPPPDLIPDLDDPALKKTVPANGALNVATPFVIELEFTEPVKNVDKNTVQVTDVNGNTVEVTFASEADGAVWKLTPTKPVLLASPYTVTVNFPTQVILDQAGNKMDGIEEFTFFTAAPANLEPYDALAAKYAPLVRIHTQGNNKAHLDYPTRINADGDWDLTDNKAWTENPNTKEMVPATHYSVIETESHYFVHYVWFWSVRNDNDGNEFYENDASGALVVVEKWPTERPVELLTWFRKKGGEYIKSFPTTESGIFESSTSDEGVTEVFDQSVLFPSDQFEIFLSAGAHEACLWAHEGNNTACDLNAGDKIVFEQSTIIAHPGEPATPIKRKGATWPVNTAAALGEEQEQVNYALVDLLRDWWPRRTQTDTLFFNTFSTYTVMGGAPGAPAQVAKFPRFFLNAAGEQSQGRTPWSVVWKPGDGTQYVAGLPSGQFFFDPAQHLKERHGTAYTDTAFNPETQQGFSTTWCFNPYLGIDIRGGDNAACP